MNNLIHYMNLHPEPFHKIKYKQKDIELRLLDEKRQMIQVGDFIKFTNTENSECKLSAVVVALHKFPSFDKLYESLSLLRCGYTIDNINQASSADMDVYYPKEKQQKYGVVGIEIRVL
ncbi:ASCH domain-containing protein [Facklamia sp. P12945]|uniref:ASCH domain-containing protein n=1 Tax=unclassified Facklamia TaxID=2622293 RepID=UPI003D163C37